jgi:hypothetical protein
MTPATIEIQGTLQPDGTLVLDEKPALPPGRVRIVLESQVSAADRFLAFVEGIRKRHESSGYVPPSAQEIDADLKAERQEWEDHQLALEHIQEESRKAREQPPC